MPTGVRRADTTDNALGYAGPGNPAPYAWLSAAAAAIVIAMGVLVLLGWAIDSAALRGILPRLVPMAPLTALGFILSGAALLLLRIVGRRSRWAIGARVLAMGAAAIGLLTLLEYATGADLWIDRLLFEEELSALPYRPVGRIAPNTAFGFLLTGLSLFGVGARGARSAWYAQLLALLVALASMQALIGYAYGVESLYGLARYTPIAVHTAAAFLILASGIMLARSDAGAVAALSGRTAGAFMARRLLPTAVLTLFLLGWLRVVGEEAGLFGSRFGASLLVIAGIVLLAGLVWWTAVAVNRVDEQRLRLIAAERTARREADSSRREAERRAGEERALRAAAEAVAGSFTVEDIIHQMARRAVAATAADGAFVQRIDPGAEMIEIVAAEGSETPPVGERIPYAGSATALVIAERTILTYARVGKAEGPVPDDLRQHCPDCAACVVPLLDAGTAIGSLVILRRPGRSPFDEDEVARASTFGDIASLAFRKVHLLEDSERRSAELRRVLESRSRLVRGFSHDVKNPLGAAEGQLALLDEGVLDGELRPKQKNGVERARRSIGTALRLIDALVELGRAEAGAITLHVAATDVAGVARELCDEYRAAADASGVELRFEPTDRPVVRSDPDRVRQVLGNLLSNAVKYTPADGTVAVRVAERARTGRDASGRWIVVEVADSGPGIPEDRREEVFGEFTRLEPGEGRGSGLGLAISRRLARMLGGDITLDSRVGGGSVFTLWLPPGGPDEDVPTDAAPPQVERVAGPATGGTSAARVPQVTAPHGGRSRPSDEPPDEALAGAEPDSGPSAAPDPHADEQRFLAEAGQVLASSLDYDETLRRVARLAVPRISDWCAVDVLEDGAIRRIAVAHADPAREALAQKVAERWPTDPDAPRGLAHVLRTGKPELYEEVTGRILREAARDDEHLRILRELGLRSAMIVPMIARGQIIGAISLIAAESGRRFGPDDLGFVRQLALRAALAVDNARLYQEAVAASRAKSNFLAVMSHELRTPLTAVIGYAEIMESGIDGPLTDAQRERLDRIKMSARHLVELIEEILTFARIESERERLLPREIDLAEAARETAAVVAPSVEQKGLRFTADVPAGPVRAVTDASKVRRILMNLLGNAVKFTREGAVELALRPHDETITFEVRDTGEGIRASDLDRIFEPFWQAEATLTREAGGTGLGLTVARRLTEMLGGELTVESSPGRGSTFTVRLPRDALGSPRHGGPIENARNRVRSGTGDAGKPT